MSRFSKFTVTGKEKQEFLPEDLRGLYKQVGQKRYNKIISNYYDKRIKKAKKGK